MDHYQQHEASEVTSFPLRVDFEVQRIQIKVEDLPFLLEEVNHGEKPAPHLGIDVSDVALTEAIARGDRQAMRLLYERHSAKVYRFALHLIADKTGAEDLVSEVFLDVWRKAGTFEGRSGLSTWLLAITRNKAIENSRRRSPELMDDAAAQIIEDKTDGPEIVLQKRQASSVLFEALKCLSRAHREIIDLVYYHEESIDDVAQILSVPVSTVKTRMFYARKRLAQVLAQAGHDRALLPA